MNGLSVAFLGVYAEVAANPAAHIADIKVEMPMRSHPPSPGFTTVEIIVVLLVLAIGSAMVVPLFNGSSVTQLRTAAQLLAADLDAAKVESITHADDSRVVVFDLTEHTYHIAPSSTPAAAITNPYDRKPYVVDFGKGRALSLPDVTIDSVDLDGDEQLGFGIYGQLDQDTAATITLAADGATVTLTLDPATGEVTVGQIQ